MRALKNRRNWLLIAVLGAGIAVFIASIAPFEAQVDSAQAQAPAQTPTIPSASAPARGDNSTIFTTDHHSFTAALRDFLGFRPEPIQPIAFPHKTHLANGLKCLDCHAGADTGPDAAIPSVKFCMTCHLVIATDKPEIKKMAAIRARGEDISWVRVYDYSQYAHVRFNHAPHIRADVPCASCHGDMTKQTTAQRVVNLNMGYCLSCHQERKVSVDCQTCHF
jgi:hypothetical protein